MRPFACLFALSLCASASATSVVPMTDAQLVSASEVVIDGVVLDSHARWVGRRIVTFTTLRVDAVIAGGWPTQRSTLVVATLGGVVGELGQRVHGSPVLPVGARLVLCLTGATGPDGAHLIVGFSQGVWPVDALTAAPLHERLLRARAGRSP